MTTTIETITPITRKGGEILAVRRRLIVVTATPPPPMAQVAEKRTIDQAREAWRRSHRLRTKSY